MKKSSDKIYVFTNTVSNELNAGPKAPRDILKILKDNYEISYRLFYCPVNKFEKIREQIRKLYLFYYAYCKNHTITIVQYPLIKYKKLTKKLGDNGILWIHDLNSIRYGSESEIDILNSYRYIVAHNDKMKNFLTKNKIDQNKIKILECFDYLCDKIPDKKRKFDSQNITIAFAGNLVIEKTPFLYQLDEDAMNYTLYVYGVGITKNINSKILYQGSFLPEKLPSQFDADLGLVWDGNYDESDENEGFKHYTKYNNPHKLSCYLAADLPVIVWEKAAIKDFVLKYNVGYTISTLKDINKLDFSTYKEKKKNAEKLGEKVRGGFFTKKMIECILNEEKDEV